MRKRLLLLLLAPLCFSQTSNTVTRQFAGVPTGSCSFLQLGLNKSNGDLYDCLNGVWHKVSGGAGAGTVTNTGTLTSGQLIKGNGGVDITVGDLSGDVTTSGSTATTVVKVNGASVPTSASVLGSNGSAQLVADTSHNLAAPLLCVDSSGSGTAQLCTTSPSFTPAAGDTILYRTTTTNTGALTLNVNSSSAQAVNYVGAALSGGEIILGHFYLLAMNSAATVWDVIGSSGYAGARTTVYNSHSTNTFTAPTNCNTLTFILYGAGGSGAGGQVKATNNTVTLAGSGGGGGAYSARTFKCSDLSAPIVVTVGTGGAGVAASTSGNPGTASTVTMNAVQVLFAGGGGAGLSNNGVAAITGGGGGGSIGSGLIGNTANTIGGSPATVAGAVGISGQGAGGNVGSANETAEYGGAAGGASTASSAIAGGGSIYGAPGGGSGGPVSSTTAAQNGGDGGLPQSFSIGGGATHGALCSTNGCTATNGSAATNGAGSAIAGGGGAGGGGCATTVSGGTCTAGNGSAGKAAGAGGGGGGAANTNAGTGTAGTGGAGADGYAIVIVN